MNTLTVPKIKDLVNKPNEQYKDIFDTLNNNMAAQHTTAVQHTTAIQNTVASQSMTDELSIFLNELKKNNA